MNKIITIFKRDMDNGGKILKEYAIDPERFLYATATEKIDGTNVRLTIRNHTIVRLEKRRNPDKIQKLKGIIEPWYVDADEYAKEDKWIWDAARNTQLDHVPDGEWNAEAVGTNIQGNPLKLTANRVFFFSLPEVKKQLKFDNVPTTFDELKEWLPKQKSKVGIDAPIEGIVWHLPDGTAMKIKTKDFK